MQVNHVAFTVADLDAACARLPPACRPQPRERQEADGTIEQYIELGGDDCPSLLLIQAVADGPYRRAVAKRGHGLHHLGVVTHSMAQAVAHAHATAGLLLHPISLQTLPRKLAWLARPGLPFLVELMEWPEACRPYAEVGLVAPAGTAGPERCAGLCQNLRLTAGSQAGWTLSVADCAVAL